MFNDRSHVLMLMISGIVTLLLLALVQIMTISFPTFFRYPANVARTRLSFGVLLMEYLFLTACSTAIIWNPTDVARIELTPCWNYSEMFREGGVKNVYEVINNILFFVPIGIIVPLTFGYRGFCRSLMCTVLFGLLVSVSVEVTQYFTKLGFCETDDVIHNVVGTALGYLIFLLIDKLVRTLSHKQIDI